ncbi:rhodanese-like domain-containing protein [Aedoeadaptatus pacaensis]|uniref:rhodanese-like domain-containing protein n=1 Tax=Aedoeadaptatus pacaensis TaxID=1776390 RepID=UPI0008383CEE|nr:rhodanese-like domain-containing protein [Peptoniphilus pacaensis]
MKKLNVLALAAVLAFGLTACGSGDNSGNNAAANNAAANNTAAAENNQAEDKAADVAEVGEISGEELDKIMEDKDAKEKVTVIDVRPAEDYDAGHVKYAINMPIDTFEENLSKIEDLKDAEVITICNTGKKSGEAADILVKNGFTNVKNAQGVKDFEYTTMTKAANVRGPEFLELAKSGDYTIIDARDAKDFEAGHLDGAINVLVDEFDAKYPELPTDKPFLVHCYSGNRSWEIANKLAEKGHKAINSNDGTKEFDGFGLK